MLQKKTPLIIAAILAALSLIIIGGFVAKGASVKISQEDLAASRAYLQSLEDKDPAMVDKQIRLIRQQRIQSMKDELETQLLTGEVSVWSLFEDYLILGDSRTIGFSYNGFLPEDNVWAETGATIWNLEEMLPDVIAAAPSYIYVTYGMNDFCAGIWDGPSDFTADYKVLLQQIQAQLPDTTIVVCSILPATEAAYERAQIWSVIPDYNAALKEMCDSLEKCYYVDGDGIAEQYEALYDADGVHFLKDFYPYWAVSMIMEVYNNEFFIDDEADVPTSDVPE